MEEEMRVETSGIYEEFAIEWQVAEIARLNEVLKAHGIADKETRKSICDDYTCGAGYFLDQGLITLKGREVRVSAAFTENETTVYMPSQYWAAHEYASSNVDYFFEEANENPDTLNVSPPIGP